MIQWRLHTHFELLSGVPTRTDVTPNGGREYKERAVWESTLEPHRLFLALTKQLRQRVAGFAANGERRTQRR